MPKTVATWTGQIMNGEVQKDVMRKGGQLKTRSEERRSKIKVKLSKSVIVKVFRVWRWLSSSFREPVLFYNFYWLSEMADIFERKLNLGHLSRRSFLNYPSFVPFRGFTSSEISEIKTFFYVPRVRVTSLSVLSVPSIPAPKIPDDSKRLFHWPRCINTCYTERTLVDQAI